MTSYILNVTDRNYTGYEWLPFRQEESQVMPPSVSPLESKLFHHDIVTQAGKLISSRYRNLTKISGVLIIDGKTYGRANGKLLYKCIPDELQLPCFLIPYEENLKTFSKLKVNKYITFCFKEWTMKPPVGILTNNFGNVDDIEAYINYQLECKGLNSSIKPLNNALLACVEKAEMLPHKDIEDRRTADIFSIDPHGCNDIDDAIGIQTTPDGQTILSIYIANVPFMLEQLNLWKYMSDRISTIYFSSKKIMMLPATLSEDKFSLRQAEDRVAFVLDVYLNKTSAISDIKYSTVLICVNKNYVYEEQALLAQPAYQSLQQIVRELNNNGLHYVDQVADSHDVVEFCMILMNYECSKLLREKNRGIFRSATKPQKKGTNDETIMPPELKKIMQGTVGEYCSVETCKPHELIAGGLPSYVHITSPIRRLVDCINMLELQRDTFINSVEAEQFLEKWYAKIAYINEKTKAIRRLQNDIELLQLHYANNKRIYDGIVFLPASNLKYKVYIPELKLITTIFSNQEITNYSLAKFTSHLFMDEMKMTKKVRLQLIC